MPTPSSSIDLTSPAAAPGRNELTPQQVGMVAAALVAFLGVTYTGPALTRLLRKPTLRERAERRWVDARRRAARASAKAKGKIRRLGGTVSF
jgi:hypothetical protein